MKRYCYFSYSTIQASNYARSPENPKGYFLVCDKRTGNVFPATDMITASPQDKEDISDFFPTSIKMKKIPAGNWLVIQDMQGNNYFQKAATQLSNEAYHNLITNLGNADKALSQRTTDQMMLLNTTPTFPKTAREKAAYNCGKGTRQCRKTKTATKDEPISATYWQRNLKHSNNNHSQNCKRIDKCHRLQPFP